MMKKKAMIKKVNERLRPDKSEVFRLWCNNSKLKQLTGFEPTFTLEKGLRITVDWFTNPDNIKKYKANIYNV